MAEFILTKDLFIKLEWGIRSSILGRENRTNKQTKAKRQEITSREILPQARGREWQLVC